MITQSASIQIYGVRVNSIEDVAIDPGTVGLHRRSLRSDDISHITGPAEPDPWSRVTTKLIICGEIVAVLW